MSDASMQPKEQLVYTRTADANYVLLWCEDNYQESPETSGEPTRGVCEKVYYMNKDLST